jgi:hypothetical protein
MMIVIGILHFTRVASDATKDDRALAPMIAFELLLNYFKVGHSQSMSSSRLSICFSNEFAQTALKSTWLLQVIMATASCFGVHP